MCLSVTPRAQDNQILSGVVSQLAPRLWVVNFEVFHSPARLAPPAISRQNFSAQPNICAGLKL